MRVGDKVIRDEDHCRPTGGIQAARGHRPGVERSVSQVNAWIGIPLITVAV